MYITELILLLVILVTKKIYFDHIKGKSDEKINTRKVKVYRGKEYFEDMDWGEVRQGDVVYLTQG